MTIDTAAPAAPVIASFSNDSGVAGDGITNDNTLSSPAAPRPTARSAVYDGATLLGTATANGSGAWTFTTAALTDGAHSFTAVAIDAAGNTSGVSSALFLEIGNRAATVSASNQALKAGTTVAASSLFSATDADGDAIVTYRLYDSTGSAASGKFLLNGVDQGYNQNINLTAAQLAQTTFVAGSVQDQLWVQVYDGTTWSQWYEFYNTPPVNRAPVATVTNQAHKAGVTVAASSFFSATDADGDAIVTYRLYDSTGSAASGKFLLNGVDQGYNQSINLTAAQLAQTTFVAGSVQDQLWVQVYDGTTWSQWYEFYNTPPVNRAPVATVTNQAHKAGVTVAASSFFSATDADGDAIVTYRLYDSTGSAASGKFLLNGVDQGYSQSINLTAAQLAQTTFVAGSVQDQLWVQVYDGTTWSQWYEFYNTPPVNRAPVATVTNQAHKAGTTVAASSFFSATDADGDAIVTYRLYDSTGSAASGKFLLNGVDQGYNQSINLTAAQLAQTTFVAGSVQDQLWVQVYDGTTWSQWYEFYNTPPVNRAPVATVTNQAHKAGVTVAASSFFSATDADGDAIVTYRLYDSTGSAASGKFLLNGVDQGYNQSINLTAAQLAQTTFVAGSVQDQLWVQVYDGTTWSQWYEFYNTPPVNRAPVVTVANHVSAAGSTVAASSMFLVNDADGDTIVTYRLYDSTGSAASGKFLLNGVDQGYNQSINLTAAQLAQTTFVAGSVQDQLWVQVYDGTAWSQWYEFYSKPPAQSQGNSAPTVAVANPSVPAGDSVAASSLFLVSDADGDAIVTYRLYDQTPGASSGHFEVNGVQQGTNQNIDLTATQFAQATYVAGAQADLLWVQVYDGKAWSAWYEL